MALSSVRRISAAGAIAILAIALAGAPGASSAPNKVIPLDFGWSPTAPKPGQVVTFTAAANPPSGVSIRSYDWDLNGDGSIEKHGASATWSYPAPGTVTVRLHVTADGNRAGDAVHRVPVQAPGGGPVPIPPVASFTIEPAAPVAGQPVQFTSTSSDSDGTLTEQVWDLNGDGNYDNGGGATALRSFAEAGVYAVGLRVTDDAGLVSFDSRMLTVAPAPGAPVTTQQAGGLRLLSPFPVVRMTGRITGRGTRVRLLRVRAPVRTKITVRCTGRSCPFRKQVRAVPRGARSRTASTVRVRRLERLLLPGVQVRVYVTKRGEVGKYTRFRVRAGNAPVRTDRCVMPGSLTPAECPVL